MRYQTTILLLALTLGAGTLMAQPRDAYRLDTSAEAAAREALQTFVRLVTPQNFQAMGFDNPQQVRSATLDTPVRGFMIQLNELKGYEAGTDPARLLHDLETLTFPVLVQESPRSSLTLQRRGQRWVATSFGAPQYARLLAQTRDRLVAADRSNTGEVFEVRVPALNLTFLGHRQGDRLLLTPITDDPRTQLKKGEPRAAEEVLQVLRTLAREHNGLPT